MLHFHQYCQIPPKKLNFELYSAYVSIVYFLKILELYFCSCVNVIHILIKIIFSSTNLETFYIVQIQPITN